MNRCCSLKIKIIILVYFLFYSFLFLSLNIYDYIIYWKDQKHYNIKEQLSNNYVIFILQIFSSVTMLLFLLIILFINQGENHNYIISSIIAIIIFSLAKIFFYIKTIKISITIIFNLIYSILILSTNIILLILMMVIKKKRKMYYII